MKKVPTIAAASFALTILVLVGGTFYRAGIIVEKIAAVAGSVEDHEDRITALERIRPASPLTFRP